MYPKMYTAAMENKVEDLKQYGADEFALQITPNSNTVLHVAALFDRAECATYILSVCPSLLHRVNTDGNTPIHVALARNKLGVLSSLVDFARSEGGGAVGEILRARNNDGNKPLHACSNSINDFLPLVSTELENPGIDHGPNKAGETPVYLYMKWGSSFDGGEMLRKLLKTCTLQECGGPEGRTALHAAVIHYASGKFLDVLMGWKEDLIKEQDTRGLTPLHYAADQNRYAEGVVEKLLDKNESVAYVIADNDLGNTALHMASGKGHIKIMEAILSKCPDCWEMLNSKRQNILHISADMEKDEVTKYISGQKWAIDLVNRKDHEGNTPMHMIAQNQKENKKLYSLFRGVGWKISNNKGLTPIDILLPKISRQNSIRKKFFKKLDQKDREEKEKTVPKKDGSGTGEANKGIRPDQTEFETFMATFMRETEANKAAEDVGKMTDTHLIVATLISTMSFAAGFTIPGGYHGDADPNEGRALLVREAAFKAFVITNTIAVVCSTSSVFLYVSASLFNTSGPDEERRARRHAIAFRLIITAMLAMTVAFSTGAYVVLSHSLGLAIVTCVIACSSSIVYAVELRKHFTDEIAHFMGTMEYYLLYRVTRRVKGLWHRMTRMLKR